MGRSCQDLYICNNKVESQALKGLGIRLLIDCTGGGHGHREPQGRGWRDADQDDECSRGCQSPQTGRGMHTYAGTHTDGVSEGPTMAHGSCTHMQTYQTLVGALVLG